MEACAKRYQSPDGAHHATPPPLANDDGGKQRDQIRSSHSGRLSAKIARQKRIASWVSGSDELSLSCWALFPRCCWCCDGITGLSSTPPVSTSPPSAAPPCVRGLLHVTSMVRKSVVSRLRWLGAVLLSSAIANQPTSAATSRACHQLLWDGARDKGDSAELLICLST